MKLADGFGPSPVSLTIGRNCCAIYLGYQPDGAQFSGDSFPFPPGFPLDMVRATRNLEFCPEFLTIDAIGLFAGTVPESYPHTKSICFKDLY